MEESKLKKKAIVLSLLFLCVFGLAGCRSGDKENGTKGAETTKAESQVKELSMDTLVADLEDAILSGESQLTCVYTVSYTHLDVYKRQGVTVEE